MTWITALLKAIDDWAKRVWGQKPPPETPPIEAPHPNPPLAFLPDHTIMSPNFNNNREHTIDTIILHNTEGTVSSAVGRFMNASEQVSAHFIIGRDGKSTKMVLEANTAWHSGNRDTNHRSFGIEIEAGGGTGVGMTPVQEAKVIELCKYLRRKYGIPVNRVFPHRHVVSTSCPGSIWKSDALFYEWVKSHA